MAPVARVLVVAGSDSGGGAGIQADIKTITALGGYAATAITALTAQNTLGVHGAMLVPADFVRQQMEVTLEDLGADGIKTGMLGNADIVRSVARVLERYRTIPLVLDPVMLAKGGHPLLDTEAQIVLRELLLPKAALLTPNLPEAEVLSGLAIDSPKDMAAAADKLLMMGASAVLLKGGHLEGPQVVDLLRTADGDQLWLESERIVSRSTHGTGCTLASAVATGVAAGLTLTDAATRGHAYVQAAIRQAPGLGQGHGPLGHALGGVF